MRALGGRDFQLFELFSLEELVDVSPFFLFFKYFIPSRFFMIAARIAVVMKQLRIHVCIHLMYVCCFNLPRRKANKRAKQKQRK